MIHSVKAAKSLVVLLLILVVVSSTFSGTGMSVPVAGEDAADPNAISLPTAHSLTADHGDTTGSSNHSSITQSNTTSLVVDNKNIGDSSDRIVEHDYRPSRSEVIQSEIDAMTKSPSIASNNTSQVSSNETNVPDEFQALQTPIIGHFSGTYQLEFVSPIPGFPPGHVTGTMAGDLSSDNGRNYSPVGTWQMSYDYLNFDHSGQPVSHSYSGPASPVCGGSVHSICIEPGNLGYLEYNAASNTFTHEVLAHDEELGATPPLHAPIVPADHPLSGSDSRSGQDAFETSSWTFTPGPVDQCVPLSGVSSEAGQH